MHELSVALALIDMASEELDRLGHVRLQAVHVRIGGLAAIVPDALRFSFDLAADGTPIAGARLEIEAVPITLRCPACGEVTLQAGHPLRCPRCGGAGDLLSGRELELRALEVSDDDGTHR